MDSQSVTTTAVGGDERSLHFISDESPDVRRAIACNFVELGGRLDQLWPLLDDEDMHEAAIEALEKIVKTEAELAAGWYLRDDPVHDNRIYRVTEAIRARLGLPKGWQPPPQP